MVPFDRESEAGLRIISILERLHPIAPNFVYQVLNCKNNTVCDDEQFMSVYWPLIREARMLLTTREAFNLYWYILKALKADGDIAELGVYRGGSAKLLSSYKKHRTLHLFDTFGGMPDVNASIDLHKRGDFCDTSADSVTKYLAGFPNVILHPGFFPDSTKDLAADTRFCFVHLDVDIYESTLAGLNFFYPRLNAGGYLLSHDYSSISCPGVKKAFDEFFVDKPEEVIRLWDTQCVLRKL
ncbi:MAG TPA: TylF/MycF/NovP-related O-methyltransferase [Pirellulales bacterium]